MRPVTWILFAGTALVAVAATTAFAVASGGTPRAATSQPTVSTGTVARGPLADMVSVDGILTYQARPDGAPYAMINQMRGTYTALPQPGDTVGCGDVLYRVDDRPVLLLCGTTPAYRSLAQGDHGPDIAELNANLVHLGYATASQLHPHSRTFTAATASALVKLQAARGQRPPGFLGFGQAAFLPKPVRIATVAAGLAESAQPGSKALDATSTTLGVQLALDPSQQGQVKVGDRAQITLPDNSSVPGKVDRLGRTAQVADGQEGGPGSGPTIPAFIRLDDPAAAGRLDQAPVQEAITIKGVADALSVPVTAIVGKAGGGFAVEVLRADGQHQLVAVSLGLFDTAGGRVQVDGDVRPGDHVVVPSS